MEDHMIARTTTNPQAAEHMRTVENELRNRSQVRRPTQSQVIEAVCVACNVTELDLITPGKCDATADARQVAAVCLYDLCRDSSYPVVARRMGCRGHSTTHHRYHRPRTDEVNRLIGEVYALLGFERKDGNDE